MAKKKPVKKKTPKKTKEKSRNDISIVNEVKEPFSWARFWDEKVVDNWNAFKGYLDKKGVLYLLLSPFRYRARLIARLWLIVIAILIGVVPRVNSLMNETKSQFRASEFVQIKDSRFTSGRLSILPLLSSHEDNVHIMAFNIVGSTSAGVSSVTDGYDVRLTPNQSISDPDNIFYSYQIIPFTVDQRILLVKLDLTKTNNTGGTYQLWINQKDQLFMEGGLDIVISKQQETTDLYKNGKIDLSSLSSLLSTRGSNSDIQSNKSEIEELLSSYQLNEERLNALGITLKNTTEAVGTYINDNLVYKDVEDDSTSSVVSGEPVLPTAVPKLEVAIEFEGQTFTEQDYQQSTGQLSQYAGEIVSVMELTGQIQSAVNSLNNARANKYTELYALSRTLNNAVDDSKFTTPVSISDTTVPVVK